MTTQPLPEGLHRTLQEQELRRGDLSQTLDQHMPQHLGEGKLCCCVAFCLARATQKLERGSQHKSFASLQVPSAAARQFGKGTFLWLQGVWAQPPVPVSWASCCMYDPYHCTWQPCKLLNRSAHIQAFIPAWRLPCFHLQKGRRIISNRPTVTHGSH